MTRLFSIKYDSHKTRVEGKIDYKRKVFIAFEGLNTEPEYFERINKYLNSQKTFMVEIFPVDRQRNDGKSHPHYVREGMIEYYEEIKDGFSKSKDMLCIIIDIDKHFGETEAIVKQKYCEYLSTLKTKDLIKVNAYVTNPCFELWLILQFVDGSQLDLVQVKENKKVRGLTYTKRILKELEKENEQMPIDQRVKNSRIHSVNHVFENCLINLYNKVGTNLNELFDQIFGVIN